MAKQTALQALLNSFRALSNPQKIEFIHLVAMESDADLFGVFWNALPTKERLPFMRPLLQHVVSTLRPVLIREAIPIIRRFPELSDDELIEPISEAYTASTIDFEQGIVLREQSRFKERRDPKPRKTDRDDEIVQLRDTPSTDGEIRSFGQIAMLLKDRYPEITASAVGRAYQRAKGKKSKKNSAIMRCAAHSFAAQRIIALRIL